MCHLRNVYSLVPSEARNASHCKFTLPDNVCGKFYVTDSCLIICDGHLYDPCLCDNNTGCAVLAL